MDLRTLIIKKRDGLELAPHEIRDWIQGLVEGAFPEYQVSALLMAILLNGMTFKETAHLTHEMARHGTPIPRKRGIKRVGKHSTGGVGDKATLLVAPLVASYGVQVPSMSGRGLGHTGGTIDKLSGIPGIKTALTPKRVQKILQTGGFCIFEQTKHFAPADQILYALRDATGTVESIPLIVSSILSKKLQENSDGLVLDVKYGLGSLMGPLARAKMLAKALLKVAKAQGLKATALLTAMDQPLGHWVGNNVEIHECLQILRGSGAPDLVSLVSVLAREMLHMVRPKEKVPSLKELENRLLGGDLLKMFLSGLKSQGEHLKKGWSPPRAKGQLVIASSRRGWVQEIHAKRIGEAIVQLGGGRKMLGDSIHPRVGIHFFKKVGQKVQKGEPLAKVYCLPKKDPIQTQKHIQNAFKIGRRKIRLKPLIAMVLKNY